MGFGGGQRSRRSTRFVYCDLRALPHYMSLVFPFFVRRLRDTNGREAKEKDRKKYLNRPAHWKEPCCVDKHDKCAQGAFDHVFRCRCIAFWDLSFVSAHVQQRQNTRPGLRREQCESFVPNSGLNSPRVEMKVGSREPSVKRRWVERGVEKLNFNPGREWSSPRVELAPG